MINSVNATQDVEKLYAEKGLQSYPVNGQYVSMRGNKLERTVSNDSFESENKKSGKGLKIAAVISAASLIAAGVILRKGGKVLEGKNATLKEKLKAGFEELTGKAKKAAETAKTETEKVVKENAEAETAKAAETANATEEAVKDANKIAEERVSAAYARLMKQAPNRAELEKLRPEIEKYGSEADKELLKNMEKKFDHLRYAELSSKNYQHNARLIDEQLPISKNNSSDAVVVLKDGKFQLSDKAAAEIEISKAGVTELEKELQAKADAVLKKLNKRNIKIGELEAMRDEVLATNDNKTIKRYIDLWLKKTKGKNFETMKDVISCGTEAQQAMYAQQIKAEYARRFREAMRNASEVME